MFMDVGDAFNDNPEWKKGVGTGIRWISPVGPIRLDFAWGWMPRRAMSSKSTSL